MRVAVLGASGFIGKFLVSRLQWRADEVVTTSLRNPELAAEETCGCDVVVNLSGEPVQQRWNARAKAEIERSRVEIPARYFAALAKLAQRPKAYISASAIGYYGMSETETFTEESPPGNDFLAQVCVKWEAQARRAADLGMRVGIARTGIVLAKDGGILKQLVPIFKSGAGGVLGNGRQWFSWIHVGDVVELYVRMIDGQSGVYNLTAPEPVTNAEFTQALGEYLHRPAILPAPAFALRMALGEGADIALKGQRVLPARALAEGYQFRHAGLTSAMMSFFGPDPIDGS